MKPTVTPLTRSSLSCVCVSSCVDCNINTKLVLSMGCCWLDKHDVIYSSVRFIVFNVLVIPKYKMPARNFSGAVWHEEKRESVAIMLD